MLSTGQSDISSKSYITARNSQSTKPFHADTDARLAVSTVPPMTTNFYEMMSWREAEVIQERNEHTRVS